MLTVIDLQFGLEEFPCSEEGCLALIEKEDNDLTENDLDELKYLAESVRWALGVVA